MPSSVERPAGRGHLGRAAVDHQQVRRVGEPARPALLGRDPLLVAPVRLLLEVAGEAAAHDLGHGGGVVGALGDREAAVVGLLGQPVLEHDHAGHDVGALDVRDVDALDAQRGVGQLEGLLQLGERERAGGEVAGPLHPVPGEGLLGVALDGLHEVALVAALGHPQRHLAAAQLLEQLGVDVGVLRELGHEHLAGHGLPRLADAGLLVDAAVDLQQELLDQLAGGDRLDLVDDPAALAAHPPAADVEDLDRGLQLVLGEGDDVGVRAVAEDDGLLLQRPPERAEVVAEPGGLLELQRLGGGGHLALEPLDHRLGLAGHEVAEVVDDLAGAPRR